MVEAVETAESEGGPPPPHDVDAASSSAAAVDRSAFVGHIATDDKAALARLHDFASAPDDVDSTRAMPVAPELDDEDVPAHLLEQPSAPPLASSSIGSLPAPPQPLAVESFDAPGDAAPWLPVYEPQGSAPPLDPAHPVDASAPPLDSDDEGDDFAPAPRPRPQNPSSIPSVRLSHAVI